MKKLRILIGEDNELIRSSYVALFDHMGLFEFIIEATNGSEFIAKFENQDFDMVLIDYNMPKKNGLYCLEYLRKKNFDMSRTILCTGEMNEVIVAQALKLGCDKLITKPPKRELIEQRIYEVASICQGYKISA